MNVNMVYPPRPRGRGRVTALHCSGAGAGQWNYLAEALGGGYEVLAPEHFANESTGPWTGASLTSSRVGSPLKPEPGQARRLALRLTRL